MTPHVQKETKSSMQKVVISLCLRMRLWKPPLFQARECDTTGLLEITSLPRKGTRRSLDTSVSLLLRKSASCSVLSSVGCWCTDTPQCWPARQHGFITFGACCLCVKAALDNTTSTIPRRHLHLGLARMGNEAAASEKRVLKECSSTVEVCGHECGSHLRADVSMAVIARIPRGASSVRNRHGSTFSP